MNRLSKIFLTKHPSKYDNASRRGHAAYGYRSKSARSRIMITLMGRSQLCGDGVSRRDFLRLGALAVGGLTLADVLRLQAQAGSPGAPTSVIMIYLPGG